jgi:hypothetical protein
MFPAPVLQNDACKPTTNHHLAMNFIGAAKVQSLVFCVQLTNITDELYYQRMNE